MTKKDRLTEKIPIEFSKPPAPIFTPTLAPINEMPLPPDGLIVENGNLPESGFFETLWRYFIATPISIFTLGIYRPEYPLAHLLAN